MIIDNHDIMVHCDIKMQYLWQNYNILLQKQTFSTYLLCTLWYHVLVSEKNGTL